MTNKLPENIKGISFQDAVKSVFGVEVYEFKSQQDLKSLLVPRLDDVFSNLCKILREDPIEHTRVNEIGNMLEPFVVKALCENQITAAAATTKSGKGQSTAYPDVRFEFEGNVFYLEVKSFAADSADSKLRSFYMSPSTNPKVFENAFHLVVGFEMLDKGPTGKTRATAKGTEKALHAYLPSAFELADLYGMACDMKAEFNSNNFRMYEAERTLIEKRFD